MSQPDVSGIASDCQRPQFRWNRATPVRFGVGVLLLTAAALHVHEAWWLDPAPAEAWKLFSFVLTTLLGLWLISGAALRLAWPLTILVFSSFALYNLFQGWQGASSCGCFGVVRTNPWWVLTLDLLVVLVLAVSWPSLPRQLPWPTMRWSVPLLGLLPALWVAMLMAEDRREPFDPHRQSSQRTVHVDPALWAVGQPLSLLTVIDTQAALDIGSWWLLFYKHDCPACLEAIEQAAFQLDQGNRILIEVPPAGPADEVDLARECGWNHAHLDKQRRWFFQTPTLVRLIDGNVSQVYVQNIPWHRSELESMSIDHIE